MNNQEEYNPRNNNQENSNLIGGLLTNPKEAIAKEIMNRAEENITKGIGEKFKCNFE
jgi:hypothetical protein